MKRFLTIRIDEELYDFLKRYAKQNHTTLTGLITQYAVRLRKRVRLEEKKSDNTTSVDDDRTERKPK